ncbi:uncharacterized protein LOC116416451 isoform X1 [Nasonia vitripennis]|uniref:Transposase domain-containing protein n=1 Tax=Nasonia vitripennis TaxID=7425 RepID=A0A7M7Q2U3_NASVI|nr:uncharacterized protein LOC116416451 isoform X1 [Nasonia vitripennis]
MSRRKGKGYKNWMDPTCKKRIPKSTEYLYKHKMLKSLLENSEISEEENHDSLPHDIQSPVSLPVQNLDYQSEDFTHIGENCFIYSEMENNNNEDWINAFTNNNSVQSEICEESVQSESCEENTVYEEENNKSITKQFKKNQYLNKKLQKKTNVRYGEIILMCIMLGVRHSLTWTAMLDIFNLINKLFDEDVIHLSKYKLFNFFPENKKWFNYHIYCPVCKIYIGNRSHFSNTIVCPSCEHVIENVKKSPYFLTLNIKSQLKQLLDNPMINKHLQYKYIRQKQDSKNIEDVYDGNLYEYLSLPGNVLHDKWNFSYILNTDGCQTSDSSKVSAWPVYLKINELPPKIRDKHMILVGLWVNEEKPVLNTFLQPIITELNVIATEGIEWKMDDETIKSKFIALCCCVDSVCRCSLLNMKQFNGIFGCTFCYHPTENVEGTRKYPIDENVHLLRTHDKIVQDMILTRSVNSQSGQIETQEVNGVKGPPILLNLEYFNLSDGMTPDSMHCVYLGVTEQYTNLILGRCHEPYYVGAPNDLSVIDARLLSFKSPKIITRTCRSLTNRNSWKASEWRSWLLNYSLVSLQGIIPNKYLTHLSKLVAAIEILISDSIIPEKLSVAQNLLVEFVVYFQSYFGKEQMTYNILLLLHLTRSVINLGPLYVHDAFAFENENRLVLQMKTSPTDIPVQIAKRYMFYRSIPSFCQNFEIGNRVVEFTEDFESRLKYYVRVDKAILINGTSYELSEEEQQLGYSGICCSYKKLIYKGIRYTTSAYAQNLKINDSIIETKTGHTGIIKKICFFYDDSQNKIVFFFNPIILKKKPIFNLRHISHIKECIIKYNKLDVCQLEDLKGQCILMAVNAKNYICKIKRGCLGD